MRIEPISLSGAPRTLAAPANAFAQILKAQAPPSGAPPSGGPAPELVVWAARVAETQRRFDQVLHLAGSGRSLRPAELLGLQVTAYQASQELEFVGRVTEKAVSGLKQILQTQL